MVIAICVYWSRGIPAIRWSRFAIAREFISKALRLPSTPWYCITHVMGQGYYLKNGRVSSSCISSKIADCAKKILLVRAVANLSHNSLSRCCHRVKIFPDEELGKVRSQEVAESFVVQYLFAYDPLAMVSSHRVSLLP